MWLKTSLSAREVVGSISGRYRVLAQLLSVQAIRAEGQGLDYRAGQIDPVSPTLRCFCVLQALNREDGHQGRT